MSVIDDEGNVQVIARQSAPCIRPLATPPKSSATKNAADATWCASIRARPNANASIVPNPDRTRGGAFEPARCSRIEHSKRVRELRASGRYGRYIRFTRTGRAQYSPESLRGAPESRSARRQRDGGDRSPSLHPSRRSALREASRNT